MLGTEELFELEEELREEINENLTGILCRLNRTGQLEEFLKLAGYENLLESDSKYRVYRNGKIIVLGQSDVRADVLMMTANKMGIAKNRLELYLDYEDGKKFDIKKLEYNPKYSAVLVGPMGHSGVGKGDYGSVISAMESKNGYPPVIKLGGGSLKITKSNFKNTLTELLYNKVIEL